MILVLFLEVLLLLKMVCLIDHWLILLFVSNLYTDNPFRLEQQNPLTKKVVVNGMQLETKWCGMCVLSFVVMLSACYRYLQYISANQVITLQYVQ